ncbi:nucleotidyltransferase domain-containing protein [Glaciimonas sp. GG7]
MGTSLLKNAEMDPDTARVVNVFATMVARQYPVTGIILFGSRARHHYRPDSDADVAVLLRGQRGQFLDTVLSMADIAYDVLLETGVLIEALPVWEDEWDHPENYNNPVLLRNIAREGIRL